MTTDTPTKIPKRPDLTSILKSSVFPNENAKNGMIAGTTLLNKSRSSWSRFPSMQPSKNGMTVAASVSHGNAANPVTPNVTIVINGPDSVLIKAKAPASSFRPIWFINAK